MSTRSPTRLLGVLLIVAVGCLAWTPFALAGPSSKPPSKKPSQQKPGQNKLQNAERSLSEARARLNTAVQALGNAKAQYLASERRQDSAVLDVKRTKEQALSTHEARVGMASALQAVDDAKQDLAMARAPLLEDLRTRTDYREAVSQAEAARERLKKIREELKGEKLVEAAKQITRAIERPSDFEQAAVQANPTAREAKMALDEAQQDVATLRARIKEAMESDPQVRQALLALQQANDAVAQSRVAIAARQREVAERQASVGREALQLASAKVASQPKKKDSHHKPGKKK